MRRSAQLLLAAISLVAALLLAPWDAGPRLSVPPPAAAAPAPQHQEFVWDFSECFDHTIHIQDAEFVDAERFNLTGGCHLRLLTPGTSWVETTFSLAADPRAGDAQGGTWTLSMLHLAIRPDGPTPGLAPVRVSLNDQEIWQGRMTEGSLGPSGIWAATVVDVTPVLRRGTNRLRWDFVGGGATHYWLKLVRVGWDPR